MPWKDKAKKLEYQRQWYKTPAGRATSRRASAKQREKRRSDPEARRKAAAADRAWRIKNKEALAEQQRGRVLRSRQFVDGKKAAIGCASCGEIDPVVLKVCKTDANDSHRDVTDLAGSAGSKRILSEVISRRVVLCCNCERINRKALPRTSGDLYRWRNRDRITEEKASIGCVDCGSHDPKCLDFHHLDPSTKRAEVSALVSYGWPSIEREIAKCEVVCANCHIKRHRCQEESRVA